MEGFVESGNAHLEPLLDFRDRLAALRANPEMRMARRRSGAVSHLADGSLIPGPFTFEARRLILVELLAVQAKVGEPLISDQEIVEIKRIWAEDAARAVPSSSSPVAVE